VASCSRACASCCTSRERWTASSFDELFGAELARKGIALAIFGGVGNVNDVPEHPVVRYTAAHIAILVDAVAIDDRRERRNVPSLRVCA
jgi:hypothetical protein